MAMTEPRFERLLTETAAATVYPSTPELSGRVLARLFTPQRRLEPAFRPSVRTIALLLVLVVLTVAAAFAISPSRQAIARFFGVEGSKIERLPAPSLDVTPAPPPPRDFGAITTPVDLADFAKYGVEPALPNVAGPLLQAYVIHVRPAGAVLQYARFDLWEAELPLDAAFAKVVPANADAQQVSVGRVPGTWLSGGTHFVRILDGMGRAVPGSERTVERNTLIWRTPRFFYRIETDLPLAEALRIAVMLP